MTDHGHTWFGSGGSNGRCGVGYLFKKRCTQIQFRPISTRAAALDVQSNRNVKWRIIGVYMPHSMQPQDDVDATYATIGAEIASTRRSKYNLVIAMDFNAEVGTRTDDDDDAVIAENPMCSRCYRGDALVN